MIISVTRRGGFAGLDQPLGHIDLDELPAEGRAEAQKGIDTLQRLARETPPGAGADRFRYEVYLEKEGRTAPPIIIVDEGEWDRPLSRALADLAQTIGLPLT